MQKLILVLESKAWNDCVVLPTGYFKSAFYNKIYYF